ncbi:MAG: nucleotide exchange factor GrpE [Anaerolineae bacterium]|nr:nucleotide exchange factor GrpE [Anaerolineae bacterium]
MSHKRHVWETISELASHVGDLSGEGLAKLEEQLSKLGREQYKSNTLAQAQAERLQSTLEALQSAMTRQEVAQQEAVQKARLDVLKALLPVLDGVEAGLESGERQIAPLAPQVWRMEDGESKGEDKKISPPLPLSPSLSLRGEGEQDPQSAAILAAWLGGQRLLRDRLLAILNEAGIQPVPTVGQPFDPYRHIAVGTVEDETLSDGQIVAEERRGYAAGDHVLRYAEVVVVKNRVTSNEE